MELGQEHQLLLQGQDLDVSDYDNHLEHIVHHLDTMLAIRVQEGPVENALNHIKKHYAKVLEKENS